MLVTRSFQVPSRTCPSSSHAGDLARLLAFMLRFGVGKSRSIGFGHVTMEPPPRNLL
jgi:CRISPR/Cas system endoribonuclease Cas6 (RAMP superfamily)